VLNKTGAGQAAYIAAPIFKTLMEENQWYLRDVAHNVLQLLVPKPIVVLDAPLSVK